MEGALMRYDTWWYSGLSYKTFCVMPSWPICNKWSSILFQVVIHGHIFQHLLEYFVVSSKFLQFGYNESDVDCTGWSGTSYTANDLICLFHPFEPMLVRSVGSCSNRKHVCLDDVASLYFLNGHLIQIPPMIAMAALYTSMLLDLKIAG